MMGGGVVGMSMIVQKIKQSNYFLNQAFYTHTRTASHIPRTHIKWNKAKLDQYRLKQCF